MACDDHRGDVEQIKSYALLKIYRINRHHLSLVFVTFKVNGDDLVSFGVINDCDSRKVLRMDI